MIPLFKYVEITHWTNIDFYIQLTWPKGYIYGDLYIRHEVIWTHKDQSSVGDGSLVFRRQAKTQTKWAMIRDDVTATVWRRQVAKHPTIRDNANLDRITKKWVASSWSSVKWKVHSHKNFASLKIKLIQLPATQMITTISL